jgi:SAM-dependent methyltransferase
VSEDVIATYDAQSAELAQRYDQAELLAAYRPLDDLLMPRSADALALDIGAGSGRDAAWLLSKGFEVVAAEPSSGMRTEGQRRHSDTRIRWIDDRLPSLSRIHELGLAFDLILLSAVWQHIPPLDRPRAFRKMTTLLKPGGLLLMTLRQGPAPADRPMHPVTLAEVESLARGFGLEVFKVVEQADEMSRSEVRWTSVLLRMPDEGTGALPLIRGIILADDKSSTYKLALLRAIARIAEHAPAAVKIADDELDAVDVPLGLVALFWLRMYLPLVRLGLPQAPRNSGPDGLGFARSGFRALLDLQVSALDLRVGTTLASDRAAAAHSAINDAVRTIAAMPANFIRYPGQEQQVFRAIKRRAGAAPSSITFDVATLWSWGAMRVPGHIWRTMSRLGAWIEPVLTTEWARLCKSYAERMGRAPELGHVEAALAWEEPMRDTSLGRLAVKRILDLDQPVVCVWSGKSLRSAQIDIDHCMRKRGLEAALSV